MTKQLIQNLKKAKNQLSFDYPNDLPARLYFVTNNILRLTIDPTKKFSNEPSIMEQLEVPNGGDATVATGGSGQQQLKETIIFA